MAERLAASGLRFNRFHTTALCSPTRQALLTGRNHHAVGMGGITEIATSAPGYNSIRPDNAAPIAETLRLNGYSTAQFGKCHEVPVWETSPMGPFDQWPTGSGFEHFYGFVGAETNQWYPALYEGITPVEPPKTPEEGYHFTEDLTDHAITWVRQQKSLMPDKPFFMYFAPGATHAPHHVPPEWSDKYKGRFDAGWDALREETLARQKELGVVPAGHRAVGPAGRDPGLGRRARRPQAGAGPPDGDLRRLHGAHRPPHRPAHRRPRGAGRARRHAGLPDHRRQRGQRRGHAQRHVQRDDLAQRGGRRSRPPSSWPQRIDEFGTPGGLQPLRGGLGPRHEHPLPVDQAGGLPLRRHPQRHHRPLAQRASRPRARSAASSTTSSTSAPPSSTSPASRSRPSSTGSSRCRSTACPWPTPSTTPTPPSAARPSTSRWPATAASTTRVGRRSPGTASRGSSGPSCPPLDDDVWELYDTTTDWSQAHDLAAEHPDKLRELQRLWLIEAVKYNVLPLDDRRIERFNSDIAGRPVLVKGNAQLLYGGMSRLSENSVLNLKNKSHSVTAEVDVPEGGANGVIVAQGGAFAGWSLYLHDGKPKYCHNLAGLMRFYVEGDRGRSRRHPPGPDGVRLRRRRTGQGRHRRPVHRRQAGRRGADQRHRAHDLLGRRDLRRRLRHRHAGQRGLHRRVQPLHRDRQLGRARRSATTATTTSSPPRSCMRVATAIQ